MTNEYMLAALDEARIAGEIGEIPVGAVVVRGGIIVARGHNTRERDKNALAHAETEAIRSACAALDGWRLSGCDLFVTLEPCPMCIGAALNARIRRVYFGAYDPKNGACGSVCDLPALGFTHKAEVYGGIMEEECAALLSDFFAGRRSADQARRMLP